VHALTLTLTQAAVTSYPLLNHQCAPNPNPDPGPNPYAHPVPDPKSAREGATSHWGKRPHASAFFLFSPVKGPSGRRCFLLEKGLWGVGSAQRSFQVHTCGYAGPRHVCSPRASCPGSSSPRPAVFRAKVPWVDDRVDAYGVQCTTQLLGMFSLHSPSTDIRYSATPRYGPRRREYGVRRMTRVERRWPERTYFLLSREEQQASERRVAL